MGELGLTAMNALDFIKHHQGLEYRPRHDPRKRRGTGAERLGRELPEIGFHPLKDHTLIPHPHHLALFAFAITAASYVPQIHIDQISQRAEARRIFNPLDTVTLKFAGESHLVF